MIVIPGNSDVVLRVIPLPSGCVALYLMYRLSFRVLPPIAALLSVSLFTLGRFILCFSTDFRQYSGDAAVALAIGLLTLLLIENRPSGRALHLLAAAGAWAILLSFPSVFVLAAARTVLLIRHRRVKEPRVLFNLLPVFLRWADASMPFPPWGDPRWGLRILLPCL